MSDYRRLYTPGGVYFFTLVTHERRPILCSDNAPQRLKDAFNYTNKKYPFRLTGLVILPDHLHCILQLPKNDFDFSTRWNMIKRYFSMGIIGELNHRREKRVWQKRFWEHLIRDEADLERCLDYVYYNPVKHGYVNNACDWKYSTFKRDVNKGIYEMDWGSAEEPSQIKNILFE